MELRWLREDEELIIPASLLLKLPEQMHVSALRGWRVYDTSQTLLLLQLICCYSDFIFKKVDQPTEIK